MPSTGLMPAGIDSDTGMRPRNRRGQSGLLASGSASASAMGTPGQSPAASRGVSPLASRLANSKTNSSGRASPSNGFSRGLLDGTWAPNWASVQDFATSLMAGGDTGYTSEPSRPSSRGNGKTKSNGAMSGSWGPAPPSSARPTPDDIASGSLREREERLMARKKASVLQSHEGVNGGLDVLGQYKRRNSDETPQTQVSEPIEEDHLVYLHHVQPTDTYAGIVLRYRCQEHAFRKTNGLWSQSNIQVRKHLLIPVDACEVKGRPCEAPSYYSQQVDLLAATPQPTERLGTSPRAQDVVHDDFFSSRARETDQAQQNDQDKPIDPWTHVRWVRLDSVPAPVEIVRVPRRATGYFPPRRKRSVNTVSTFSTPRHSLELSRALTNASETQGDNPSQTSSRRQSAMGARPTIGSLGSSPSTRGRGSSLGETEKVPAWMRKPGGVGSMSRSVHAPGPAGDSLNSWVNKRLPGFNIDSLPSMSVMGSESAHFGFTKSGQPGSGTGIVESPWEDGRDAPSLSKGGMGLEQAAASVETWLRGAWQKRPATPRMGSYNRRPTTQEDLDLIEMTDTNSDDGRSGGTGGAGSRGLLDQGLHGTTGLNSNPDGNSSLLLHHHNNIMPICIECQTPVRTLWTAYRGSSHPSAASSSSSGHNIRLTVCKNCGRFCDKYVEHDYVVLFIDLVLIKPQVYRHLLHNTLMRPEGDRWDKSIYMFFLILCSLSTLAFHLSIRFLTSSRFSPLSFLGLLPRYPRPNSVSTALLVSSSTKLFPILMVVWDYDVPAAARSLGWAVVANNVEALKILLDCGYGVAVLLAAAGALSRWVVGRSILALAGLEHVDAVAAMVAAGAAGGGGGGGGGGAGVIAPIGGMTGGNGGGAGLMDGRAVADWFGHFREWGGRLAVG
ncbi:uncharacterized protein B0I36DRAFT_242406 [Microdochium trichocladiopsis]|uniref:Protein ARV n=1 Tax=Microdochium trichocladiopsis TaxID=1682393 RepID=A0A9P8Y9L5_9PEZI|nr:uncharacterized protein B0I36DRAFT_242406 [Microdochium trichocladiopsis]KAH7031304.1 hypothetical protein B0I36DRAFT_242406 [Microdochium trichocladiopsis]